MIPGFKETDMLVSDCDVSVFFSLSMTWVLLHSDPYIKCQKLWVNMLLSLLRSCFFSSGSYPYRRCKPPPQMTEYNWWEQPEPGHKSTRRSWQKQQQCLDAHLDILCRWALCLFKPETKGMDFRTKARNFLSEPYSFHLSKEEFCFLIFKISCLRRASSFIILCLLIRVSDLQADLGQTARSPLSSSKDQTPEHPEAFWKVIIYDHQQRVGGESYRWWELTVSHLHGRARSWTSVVLFAFLPRCSWIILCTEGVSHARIGMRVHIPCKPSSCRWSLSYQASERNRNIFRAIMAWWALSVSGCRCVCGEGHGRLKHMHQVDKNMDVLLWKGAETTPRNLYAQ